MTSQHGDSEKFFGILGTTKPDTPSQTQGVEERLLEIFKRHRDEMYALGNLHGQKEMLEKIRKIYSADNCKTCQDTLTVLDTLEKELNDTQNDS